MTKPCPRCHTYCYGDCSASGGRSWPTRGRRAAVASRPVHQSKIVVDGVPKSREEWQQRLIEDDARLARITDASAREIVAAKIAKIRTALEA